MKKSLKIILVIIGVLILLTGIDLGSILLRNRPVFAVKDNCDCLDQVYLGLLYDTYNCWEYPSSQIKAKWTKYNCEKYIVVGKIIEINEKYIVINGLSDNNYLKTNQEAQISLSNNLKIKGANNLIIGQYIKAIAESIKEVYPSIINTHEIEIIYEDDVDF